MEHEMPRVSAAHEQEVRDRIVASAIRVFTDRGYGATIQDVVRDSGLSVGAIYTYFKSKEELFLECCEVMTSGSLETLGAMLAGKTTTAERLVTATAFYLDSIDEGPEGGPGLVTLVQAWAVADGEPRVREMLARRRERFVGAGQVLLREGIARGELPAWLDVDATARAYISLLDGMLLQRLEAGDRHRQADLERQTRAILDLVIASGRVPAPS
jgi:AcrR family transcriptional regulator